MIESIENFKEFASEMAKFKELTFQAMVHFANIDENYDGSEKKIIETYAENENIKSHYSVSIFDNPKKSKEEFQKIIMKIKKLKLDSNYTLFTLLHHLQELADADNLIKDQEIELLNVIKKHLKSKTHSDLVFDKRQEEIINLPSSERITVQALPGFGKTDTIARRIIKLYEEDRIRASEIMCVSYTRQAVKSMKMRLAKLLDKENKSYPAGIKILTLDRYATASNFQMSSKYSVINYRYTWKKFLELLNDPDQSDWRASHLDIRHIFFDEAQDITDAQQQFRKAASKKIIELASPDCGITACGDTLQQIYAYAAKGNKELEISLLQDLENDKKFKNFELTTNYRTKDNNQLNFVEDVAIEIMSMDSDELSSIENPLISIAKKDKENEIFFSVDNSLILYRWKKDMLKACHNLQSLDNNYRLTTQQDRLEPYYEGWVFKFFKYFYDKELDIVNKNQFKKFFKTLPMRYQSEKNIDEIWQLIFNYAGAEESSISINLFNEKLKRSSNLLVDFTSSDFGFRGPKISTIHSSKGTEADIVSIDDYNKEKIITNKGEAKVTFVALSRAKERVNIQKRNSSISWKWNKRFNRHYHGIKSSLKDPRAKITIETGIKGDYDPYSIVSNKMKEEEVDQTQEMLQKLYVGNKNFIIHAKRLGPLKPFRIFLEYQDHLHKLGNFTHEHTLAVNGVIEASKIIPSSLMSLYSRPNEISDLKLMDIATFKPQGNLDEQPILKKYKDIGCWLYPVIYSLQPYILHKKR